MICVGPFQLGMLYEIGHLPAASRPLDSPHLVPTSPKNQTQHPSLHADHCCKPTLLSLPPQLGSRHFLPLLPTLCKPPRPRCSNKPQHSSVQKFNGRSELCATLCKHRRDAVGLLGASPSLGTNAEHLPTIYPFSAMRWHEGFKEAYLMECWKL